MAKILYLLHGSHHLIENYRYLDERDDVDIICSTWDKPVENAHYFPGATWANGRNGLYSVIKNMEQEYEYYIFIDDDVAFEKGGFEEFEKQLLKLKPAVALPVFVPKTTHTILSVGISYFSKIYRPLSSYQVCILADAQFVAFHKDVINDNILFPLKDEFDSISWWFTSSTQQILMHTFYRHHVLQINSVVVINELHRDYPKQDYYKHQDEWFSKQFNTDIFNPRPYAVNLLTVQGIKFTLKNYKLSEFPLALKYFMYMLYYTLFYKAKTSYALPEEKVSNILKEDSELMKQFLQRGSKPDRVHDC